MSFGPTTPLPSSKYKRDSFECSSTSPLFSPSAAARYAAQAEKWNQVDKWLARVFFPSRVPPFERNDETLTYLHALSVTSTQRTKEKKALMMAQQAMAEKYVQQAAEIRKRLEPMGITPETLDDKALEALNELVAIGMALDVDPVGADAMAIAKAVSDKIDEEYEYRQRLLQMKNLKATLERELLSMRELESRLEQVQAEQEANEDTIDEKLSEWTKGKTLLQAKTEEYESRTRRKPLEVPDDLRISRLVEGEERIKELKKRVAKVQSEVDNYGMLPYDEKGAKKELQKLKAELERLRRKRDTLWEQVTG